MLSFLIAAVQAASPAGAVPSAPVPRAPLQNFISPDDYPAGTVRSAARPVSVKLEVGTDGRITSCLITSSSGAAALDQATCRLLRSRARFEPARDAGGRATSGEVAATIDWPGLGTAVARAPQMQAMQGITLAPWEGISRLRAKDGQVTSCQFNRGGVAPPPPSSNACQNFGMARMALGLAAENKVDFAKAEIVVTLRMTRAGIVAPAPASAAALLDLAAELDVGADGQVTGCRFLRDQVRSASAPRPDCRQIFRGPYIPATDRSGSPIGTKPRVEMRVEVR